MYVKKLLVLLSPSSNCLLTTVLKSFLCLLLKVMLSLDPETQFPGLQGLGSGPASSCCRQFTVHWFLSLSSLAALPRPGLNVVKERDRQPGSCPLNKCCDSWARSCAWRTQEGARVQDGEVSEAATRQCMASRFHSWSCSSTDLRLEIEAAAPRKKPWLALEAPGEAWDRGWGGEESQGGDF